MTILFIDACARKESRTRKIAEFLLGRMEGDIIRVSLPETELPDLKEDLVNKRNRDGQTGDFSDPVYDFAKQFAAADRIVIAAPFWDLSFPAVLKKYIEAVTVTGITFRYSGDGVPIGLCRAEKLYYVTTAGGPIFDDSFGYGYIRIMAQGMYGIPECHKIAAENLDIIGADVDAILEKAFDEVRGLA